MCRSETTVLGVLPSITGRFAGANAHLHIISNGSYSKLWRDVHNFEYDPYTGGHSAH